MAAPRRPYNTLGRRILRVLAETGPRNRHVLCGLAGGEDKLDAVLTRLRAQGLVKIVGSKRGSRYAAVRNRTARA